METATEYPVDVQYNAWGNEVSFLGFAGDEQEALSLLNAPWRKSVLRFTGARLVAAQFGGAYETYQAARAVWGRWVDLGYASIDPRTSVSQEHAGWVVTVQMWRGVATSGWA